MWGEREQAIQYRNELLVAKALAVKYQITAHRPFTHAWIVAKTRFVTLLSTKVLNSLEKLSCMVVDKSLSWNGTPQWRICLTSMQLL